MKKKIKVSFDFDKTLSTWRGERYAKHLIDHGIEVWVCTFRYRNPPRQHAPFFPPNDALFRRTDALGIPRDRVIFTNFTVFSSSS